MKKILISITSLTILLILSLLIYFAFILNQGEYQSKYLESFINQKLKETGLFYSTIKNPILKFDKYDKKLIIQGNDLHIFSNEDEKLAEFENLKVFLNLKSLIFGRKLDANKLNLEQGVINLPSVFSKPLKVDEIFLEGQLYSNNNEIELYKFISNIDEDYYEGSATIDVEQVKVSGYLEKLMRKKIFHNMDLSSEGLNFDADRLGFSISGTALLGGVEISLDGYKNYIDKEEFISKYNLTAIVNEKDIENSFKIKVDDFITGPIGLKATYLILKNNKEIIKTSNDLTDTQLGIPALNIVKYKDINATADVDFYYSNKKLNEVKIISYKQGNDEMNGLVKLSKDFKPYKSLELNLNRDTKKTSIKVIKNKNINNLDLKGDYFDFSKTLKATFFEEQKEDSFLIELQPLIINLEAKEILVGDEKSIYNTRGTLKYENKLFKDVELKAKLNNEKDFNLIIKPNDNSRELVINSNDAGLFLTTFNINKSGEKGELVLHGNYDDTKQTHPLHASVTIRDMRLIKAPTLAKILNLASIGIVSALSGEGILINKLKSEFDLEDGILNLTKYEAYGPDVGFSNQGKIYLKKEEVDIEGAIIPMVTLNKIIGSIPVLGKILTNERKGIWSFVYTITGDIDEPDVSVNPIKTITPGFIQKFFSVFKAEKKEEQD